jgi:hypothetical protein
MGHWLVDVHSAGFAPAFTLSFHDSEYSRKPPMPIASVVGSKPKKKESDFSKLGLHLITARKEN